MADTHFVEFDRIQHGRKSTALSGDFVVERDLSLAPTCVECRWLLAQTADEVFGPRTPGTQVVSRHVDPLKDYHPLTPKPRIKN